MTLKLAKGLNLPLEVVTKKLAWLGVTGSGKTYGATKLAELLAAAGAQFVALDPVGVWYGLRLDASGKKPSGIKVPVFGGLHGDVPIESTGGALLADLIVDKSLSAIIDVSQFESDAQKARFAEAFADRLFQRRKAAPAAMHLFLEECQEFVPQNPQRGEERMLHVFTRMQKLGRNYGIGSSYISQRPQEVNKKALNMAQTLFVFRTTGTHERKAIEQWIHDKALDQDIAGDLPKIPTGDCHVWSPEFLNISAQVHILEKATFNASSEPEVGAAAVTRELAPIDLAKIREDMAATIEKAKADDPKLLKAEVVRLQGELSKAQKVTAAGKPASKAADKPVLTESDRALLAKLAETIAGQAQRAADILTVAEAETDRLVQRAVAEYLNTTRTVAVDIAGQLETVLGRVGLKHILEKIAVVQTSAYHAHPKDNAPFAGRRAEPPARAASAVVQARGRRSVSATSGNSVGGAEQRVLDALAELEALGVSDPERVQVAFFAGYTNLNSKGLVNALGALRTGGLIEYPSTGRVVLTMEGRTAAAQIDAPRSPADVRDRIVDMLGGASARLLDPLIKVYPKAMTRDELAAASGYGNLNSKGFVNAIGRLRSLGFIDYPQQGQVAAQPVLFMEGRR